MQHSPIGPGIMTHRIIPEKMSKASENRRATKPIMEKRRRARINQCLGELKTLILDALNKDPSRHSKLEKADILEMTVRHLQNIQRQQMAAAISTDPSVLNKFRAGFSECASEVSRYVSRLEGIEPAIRQRLLGHLSNCINSLNAANGAFASANGNAFPGMTPPLLSHLQALNVHIPSVSSMQPFLPAGQQQGQSGQADSPNNVSTDINNNNNSTSGAQTPSGGSVSPPPTQQVAAKLLNGLPLIPSRLPNGDLAFLLPSQALQGNPAHLLGALVEEGRLGTTSGPSWGPPTPTSPSLSRRSSACSPGASSACLSPTGSSSEMASEDEGPVMDAPPPQVEPLSLQRVDPAPVDPQSVEPVWRPW